MHHIFSSKYNQDLKTTTTSALPSERLTLSDANPLVATVPQCLKKWIEKVFSKIFLDLINVRKMLKSVQCGSDIARGASVKSYRFADRFSMM